MAIVSPHLARRLHLALANDPDAIELIALLNGGSGGASALALALLLQSNGSLPANCFRIDTTAVLADSAARVYPDVQAAVVAAELTAYPSIVLYFTEGQAHVAWTGAGLTGTKSYTFTGLGDRGASVTVTLGAPLAVPVGPQTMKFARIDAVLSVDADMTGYTVTGESATIRGGVAPNFITCLNHVISDCDVTNVLWVMDAPLLGAVHRRSTFTVSPVAATIVFMMLDNAVINTIGCQYIVESAVAFTTTIFGHFGAGVTPILTFKAGSVVVGGSAGTVNVTDGAYSAINLDGLTVANAGGAATINWGKAGLTGRLTWEGADPTDAANLPTGTWHNVAGVISQV